MKYNAPAGIIHYNLLFTLSRLLFLYGITSVIRHALSVD